MKRSRSALVVAILTMALVLSPWVPVQNAAQAATGIKVIVNGTPLNLDTEPVIINGRTMVPLRAIFEALNARVVWSPTTSTVTGYKGTNKIQLKINDTRATVNGEPVYLEVPATIVSDRTLVPARFIAESLGAAVDWNNNTRTVTVTTGKADATPVAPPPEQPPEEKTVNGYKSGEVLRADETFEYAAGKTAVFKAGTIIEFYDNGHVKSGVLFEDTLLKFDDRTAVTFKKGSKVTFNSNGLVASGTLLNDSSLPYLKTRPNVGLPFINTDGMSTMFKGESEISFRDGCVLSGVLAKSTTLRYAKGKLVEFKDATVVEFDDNGLVKTGILSQDSPLQFILDENTKGETHAYFKRNLAVTFQEDGMVLTGVLREDTELQYADDKWAIFQENTPVTFSDKGYVRSGTLGEYCKLKYGENMENGFARGSEVIFNELGYVVSGILGSDLNAQGGIFRSDAPITFWENGKVKSATLRYDSFLTYAGGKTAQFKMDTLAEFDDRGWVTQGTLKYYQELPYTNRNYYNKVTMAPDTIVRFEKDGYVSEGTLYRDEILPYTANKTTAFKAGTVVTFDNWYVKSGTLKNDTVLPTSESTTQDCKANSQVTFDSSGYVISVINP